MMCPTCAKLAFQYTKKSCARCQGEVVLTIAVICETCSGTTKACSVCLKNIVNPNARPGGCNCGKK